MGQYGVLLCPVAEVGQAVVLLVFGEGGSLSELPLLLLDVEVQHVLLGRDQAPFFIWALIPSWPNMRWSRGALASIHEGARMRSLGLLPAILQEQLKLHCINRCLLTMRSHQDGAATLFDALSAL